MTPIKPEASAVLLTQFAGYLLSRVEAIESLLLEKQIVSKQEIQAAIRSWEASLTRQTEIHYRDEGELIAALSCARNVPGCPDAADRKAAIGCG